MPSARAATAAERQDNGRRVLDLVGEQRGRARRAFRLRNLVARGPRPAFVLAFGPPCLTIEPTELLNQRPIGQDQKAPWLAIATVGRAHGRFDDQVQIVQRQWVRAEATDRALSKHRFADGHVESGTVHGRMV
jgi:hypothetical protein